MTTDASILYNELKQLVITECDKEEITISDISDSEQLIGGPLGLDSLDALQICMAVQKHYGVRIEGGPSARKSLRSIHSLAETILSHRN